MRAPRWPIRFVLVAVVALGSAGCAPATSGPPALATVNGESLSEGAFSRFVSVKLGAFAAEPLPDTVRSELFDEFVKRQVAVQAALDRGLPTPQPPSTTTPDPDGVLSEQALDSLVDRYYREVVLKDVRVTPDEVASYYASHRAAYDGRDFEVREILVKSADEAERARRSVESGCDFADVAKAVSIAPTATQGGLSHYDPKALPPVFARAIEPLEDGQTSGVVRTDLGYHIFRLERRSEPAPLERVRDRVADDVLASKNEQLVQEDMERLLGAARVTVNRSSLPFQYEGRFAH